MALPCTAAGADARRSEIRISGREWLTAWLLAALCTTALVALTGVLPDRRELQWDNVHYLAMAEGRWHDPLARWTPFCFRPLFPWLAAALPGDVRTGFRLLAALGALAGGAGLYGCARASGFHHPLALLAIPLFLAPRSGFRYALFDLVPEGLALALLAWALYAPLLLLFAVLTAVGSLARETLGLLVIPFALARWQRGDSAARILVPTAIAGAATAVALTFARAGVRPVNDYHHLRYAIAYGSVHWLHPNGLLHVGLAVASTGGVPFFLVLLQPRGAARFLHDRIHWIAYGILFLVLVGIGGSDMERFATYLLPVLILTTLAILQDRPAFYRQPFIAAALVTLHVFSQRVFWPYPTERQLLIDDTSDFIYGRVFGLALARQAALFAGCALVFLLAQRALIRGASSQRSPLRESPRDG